VFQVARLAPGELSKHAVRVASLRTPFIVLGAIFCLISLRVGMLWDHLPP